MPLFFLIAIGAGAMTLGAATVDVVGDNQDVRAHARTAQAGQPTAFQAGAYATTEDCLKAAQQQGVPASACQKS